MPPTAARLLLAASLLGLACSSATRRDIAALQGDVRLHDERLQSLEQATTALRGRDVAELLEQAIILLEESRSGRIPQNSDAAARLTADQRRLEETITRLQARLDEVQQQLKAREESGRRR